MRRRYGQLGDLPYEREEVGPINLPGRGAGKALPGGRVRRPPGPPAWTNRDGASNFPFLVGTTSVRILPANPIRTYLLVQNKDAGADMFINFGQKATAFNGVIIIPRGNFEFIGGATGGSFCPFDSVWLLGSVANMNGVAVEGVKPTG